MRGLARPRCVAERGTAIVELALVLPVLLLLVFGTIDFGRAIYINTALANAARDGARYGMIDPNNTSCIKTQAIKYSSIANLTASGVSVSVPNVNIGQPITVSVQTTYTPITPLIANAIGASSLTLKASSTMQIRDVPSPSPACP